MKTEIDDYDIVSPKSKATFDDGLESIVKDVLQLSLDNPIPLAINYHAGVSTWQQFMYLDEVDVRGANYNDGNGTTVALTPFEQKLLRWLIGYVRENIDAHTPGSDLPSFYTKDGFTEFTLDRRKLEKVKERYGTERERELAGGLKTIEEHVVDFAVKVKKIATSTLEKHKQRAKTRQAPPPRPDGKQTAGTKQ